MLRMLKALLAAALALLLVLPGAAFAMLPEANARSNAGPMVAGRTVDPDTRDRWRHWAAGGGDESQLTTENVGRIWTDKTVRETGDGSESDFETTLSAMSSTSDTTSLSSKPLDIVLVLDASGSMTDAMGSGDRTSRIAALKDAANSFIDTIAAQNANITDAAKRHQVAIVKFAGDESNRVGNDKYRDGQYTHNYSQIMKASDACTSDTAAAFKDTVSSIEPAGATRSDNGMKLADDERCASGREDAQKIVVFFTDGTPTNNQKFESDVASSAVTSAKAVKDEGAVVYTIGIFGDANPSADVTAWGTSNENKFMQAMSSNYPQATYASSRGGYSWNFGSRAEGSDYYKSATNAGELKKVFESISQEITSGSGYPTETKDGYETRDGYITLTDELGDFMQVDGFTSAIIDGAEFGAATKTTSGNTDTYSFTGEAADLVVTVERSDKAARGDIVTVKIPAALIPLREYKVDKAASTFEVEPIGAVSPIRVTYTSSVKAVARRNLFTPDEVEGLADYIEGHWDRDANTVYFLANKWSGGELGDTVAEFEPADTNSYYYFQKDTPVYTDEACTERAVKALSGGVTYYYKDEFVAKGADGKPVDSYRVVSFQGEMAASFAGALKADGTGYYFTKGTARLAYIDQLHSAKSEVGGNATATARDVLNPQWNNDDATKNATHVQSHLGNNGKIALSLNTTPAVVDTKAAFGLTKVLEGRDWTDADGFTFNIELDEAKSSDPEGMDRKQGSVTVTRDDAGENGAAKIDFGSFAFNKPGTYAYKIWELKGGSTREGVAYSDGTVTVTIEVTVDAAGVLHAAVKPIENPTFTNTYTAETPVDGALVISAHKMLEGRAMTDGEFAFGLGYTKEGEPFDSAKNKDGKVTFAPIRFTTAAKTEGDSGLVSLPELVRNGRATLGATEDGKRAWTIEYAATEETDELPAGVTAVLDKLEITATVVDNGDGTLTATADFGDTGDTFKNEYRPVPLETEVDFGLTKQLVGRDWADDERFDFEISAAEDSPEDTPLPVQAQVSVWGRDAGNGKAAVRFGKIRFTAAGTYRYQVREVAGDIVGIAYDSHVATTTVVVTDDGQGNLAAGAPTVENGTFVNSYESSLSYSALGGLRITKVLDGRDMEDGQFAFTVTPADGASAAALGLNTGANTFAVPAASDGATAMIDVLGGRDVTFTQDDAGKTFTYTVAEDGDAPSGYTYDKAVRTVTIAVTDNGDATLAAATTVSGGPEGTRTFACTTGQQPAAPAVVPFANRYAASTDSPGGASAAIAARKEMTGRALVDGEFTFHLAYAGTTVPLVTAHNDAAGNVDFGAQRYDTDMLAELVREGHATLGVTTDGERAWTIGYVAYEDTGGLPAGVTATTASFTATVEVVDNGDGSLTAVPLIAGGSGVFRNAYATGDPVKVQLNGAKVLSAADGLTPADITGKFTFTLTSDDPNAPAPSLGWQATNDAGGDIDFGEIEFTLDDLNAALSESEEPMAQDAPTAEGAPAENGADAASSAGGVQDADDAGLADADAGNGDVTADTDGEEGPAEEGVAPSDPKVDVPLDSPVLATAAFATGGGTTTAAVDPVKPKVRSHTFTYTITETGSAAGVTNDPVATRTVSFTVTDDGQGHLAVTRDPAEGPAFTFTNTYGVTPAESRVTDQVAVTKQLVGRELRAGEFTFELVEGEGASAKVVATGTNAADGTIAMGPVTFDKPGAHTYTLRERGAGTTSAGVTYGAMTYTVVTMVTDNGDGTLAVKHELADGAQAATFTNSYEARPTKVKLGAVKMLDGRELEEGEFSFSLSGDDGTERSAKNDARGAIDFGTFDYDAAGTHVYTVSEVAGSVAGMTYDEHVYTATVNVVEDGQGNLMADIAYTCNGEPVDAVVFHNTYVKPEDPKTPGTPGTTTGPKGTSSPKAAAVKTLTGLPTTGDRGADALIVAAALAAIGTGLIIHSRRRS